MKKIALISGISGQDGSYLAELLLSKDYKVYGIERRVAVENIKHRNSRINHLQDRITMYVGDIRDYGRLFQIINEVKPDEFFHLAAQSYVGDSFKDEDTILETNIKGTVNILSILKTVKPDCKFYFAGSSEMFGEVLDSPQTEDTKFNPRSPYGISKCTGFYWTQLYRKAYNMFACNGILFNHESPRRGYEFVTRKITNAVAEIKLGVRKTLELGNLEAKRDWGYAGDYCIDLDSLILTNRGFKKRHEISVGDKVINFNIQQGNWEEDTIQKIYDVPFVGEMFYFEGNNLSFRCSPNHRIVYKKKTKKHKNWNDLTWKETTAKEIYKMFKDRKLRTKYDFCFPGFPGYNKSNEGDFKIKDDMLRLIGWIVTEGWLSKSKKIGGGNVLGVSQSKKKYYKEIKQCLQRLKLKYREVVRDDGVVSFLFLSESRDKILEYFDSLDIHNLSSFIFLLSKRQLKILHHIMMLADGSYSSRGYYSKDRKLAEDFQTISALIGYKTSFKRNKVGSYIVTMFSAVKKSKNNFIVEIRKETDISENLWCVETVKNGTIISKKNDTIFISGNCEAMWLMLQQDKPDDYIIATNTNHSIKHFLEIAFSHARLHWKDYVVVNPKFFRPAEVTSLQGNYAKARRVLGWTPKMSFVKLVKTMVDNDLQVLKDKLYGKSGDTRGY